LPHMWNANTFIRELDRMHSLELLVFLHSCTANLFSRERNLNTAIKESDLPLVGTQRRSREVPDFLVEL
jgi:hypothetical protein